jgi:hypothetical protein
LQQVVTVRGNVLGTYGGIATVRAVNGARVSAMLAITDTDYVLPVTTQGEIGLFGVAFFTEPGCSGTEYLSPYGQDSSMAPISGVIYRSLSSGQLRYVPRFAPVTTINAKSRMLFDAKRVLKCENLDRQIAVLKSLDNEAEITAFDHRQDSGASVAVTTPVPARRAGGLAKIGAGSEAAPVDMNELLAETECSPSCLWEDVGNGACDVACYVDACSYDEGDCAEEPLEELQRELDNMCSPGCFKEDIGDGFCDLACNTSACGFDNGDCSDIN